MHDICYFNTSNVTIQQIKYYNGYLYINFNTSNVTIQLVVVYF